MRQLKITNRITARDSQSIDKYLNEISKIPLLTAEEEIVLAKKIRQGDKVAFDTLTNANLRFVVSVAKQYQNQGMPLSDLINEGNVGLMKACKKFDETRGFKFISYAVWWIRQSILQAIVENSRIVRLPLNKIGSYNKVNNAFSAFVQKNERDPSLDELADILGAKKKEIKNMLRGANRHVSVDAPLKGDTENSTMLEVMVTEGEHSPDNTLIDQSLNTDLKESLKILNVKEYEVIRRYFGLKRNRSMTLVEIGEDLDLTRERVRQIKAKALNKLKASAKRHKLRTYL